MHQEIPKILHQMWIGDETKCPSKLMKTWKELNPSFDYIFWNENEIKKREMIFECTDRIDEIKEINGKCDIMRWEILYKYGGVFIDADSICIEPLDDYFMKKCAFATYENEKVRKDLVATGTMGFIKNHRLCRNIIDWIKSSESYDLIHNYKAWYSVGPMRLTHFLQTMTKKDFAVFPSYCFLPIHHTGEIYHGHRKVYGHQEWGTSHQSYDNMNQVSIPISLTKPFVWFSVLIPCYNTKRTFIKSCLDSILNQNGWFGIELVWCNDGSDEEHSRIMEEELYEFSLRSRFIKIIYSKTDENVGISECLHYGILKCTNELIFRMDSDDIMVIDRMHLQYDFMMSNVNAVICGGGIKMFDVNGKTQQIHHPTLYYNEMEKEMEKEKEKKIWIMNHPTLCFKKSAVLAIGNYEKTKTGNEDYIIEMKLLHKFGALYNLPQILVHYRLHREQITAQKKTINNELDSL